MESAELLWKRKLTHSQEKEIETLCPGKLILTVTEGGVSKYDGLMQTLIEKYGCNHYIAGLYSQVSKWVAETFESKELGTQQSLWD